MPKAILEFQLPEEKDDHTFAVHGGDMYCALWDIDQMLRGKLKYGEHEFKTADEAFEHTRQYLWEALEGRGFNFDMVS